MFTLVKATNPVYSNAEGTGIHLVVEFEEHANHPKYKSIPFLATPNDSHDHGVDLYNRAKAGEFGPIAPYIPKEE